MILAFMFAIIALLGLGIWGLCLLGEKGREKLRHWRMGLEKVGGLHLHPRCYYHPGHVWVMPQGDRTVRVGLDDFGRRLMGTIRKANLPVKGTLLQEGAVAVELDCGNKQARLICPVEGVVTTVNQTLTKHGSALERDPYGKGWLFTATVSDPRYIRLPTGVSAREWLHREIDRLCLFLHSELGATAADGGELIPNPTALLSEDQWDLLSRVFFHTSSQHDAPR
jgi:glycine cleavage system H protein